jgi:hypothetical protein
MGAEDRALVVGISVYPGLDNLEGTELDAKNFYDWVVDPEGGAVPPTQATLIRSSDFGPPFPSVVKAAPTTSAVTDYFDALQEEAQQKSAKGESDRLGRRLYLYFAGHGFAPSIDDAAILMANATPIRVGHHVPGKPWADWLYKAGYFDELLLFMDCCRENYPKAPLNLPPFIDLNSADAVDRGKRFYVFATKWARLSRERKMQDGQSHGVFTTALLAGLRQAADQNGRVTALGLRSWLFNNMKSFFDPSEPDNGEVSKEPDIFAPSDPAKDFVIATVKPLKFKVRVALEAEDAGKKVQVRDSKFKIVDSATAAPPAWEIELPRGPYLAELVGTEKTATFEVDGVGAAAGQSEIKDVKLNK